MKIVIETFVGFAILAGMLTAFSCLPGITKTPQHPHVLDDAGVPACTAEIAPALLCSATTKTNPPRECAICPDPGRHCLTSTGVYCATSCDEPLCERRK